MFIRSLRLDPYLLLLFALSLFAVAPLAAPGYFYGAHDGRHSVFFVTMFDEAIRSGAWWPRWAMHHNQGYGYPTFLVQAPLAFYLAEFFALLGFGITHAVKIAWTLAFLFGAWGMYALVKGWLLGDPAGESRSAGSREDTPVVRQAALCALVAGLLYTYAPYHLLDAYVRAAFAETMMMAWFPWVLLAFDRLILRGVEEGVQGRVLAAALSYAGLLLTHVFALVAFTPLLAGFVLLRLWMVWQAQAPAEKDVTALSRRAGLAAGAAIAALLLAAVFLVPLFLEGPLLVQEDWTRNTYDYRRHWVYWGQFFSPFWGYGYSDDPTGANDGMGFQAGVILILLAVIAGYLLVILRGQPQSKSQLSPVAVQGNNRRTLMQFLLIASLAILASTTEAAAWLWLRVSLLEVIQFPWRLLVLSTFTLSALGGLVLSQFEWPTEWLSRHEEGSLLVIALVVCFAGFGYSRPEALQPIENWREDGRAVMQFEQEHPDMIGATRFVEERYTSSPLTEQYLTPEFSNEALERLAVIAGKGEVVDHYSLGHAFGGAVMMEEPGTVQIQLYAFPGWQVKVDGEAVAARVSPPYGLMEVDVPAGYHQIDLWMGSTWPRRIGTATSILILLLLVALWLSSRWAGLTTSLQRVLFNRQAPATRAASAIKSKGRK